MIHQLIFAHPKPGMSEQEFQRYWLEVHAPNYAAKIPQIRKYAVDTRIPLGPEPADPLWSGVAEIWLENDEEQVASLQTPEFLQGARLDEPNWAAFWRTVVLDTDAHLLLPGPGAATPHPVKLILLVKRTNGTTVEQFRTRSLEQHAKVALQLPGLVRYSQNFTRDGWYGLGEALLDGAYLFNFETEEALRTAYESAEFAALLADLGEFVEPRYIHQVAAVEHWFIGSE
ncbi:EthD family reductase [Kitasatospora sp. NBC_01250]|uniref:EthD domain-containing protein n=1 Tax=unclassified Kitasatospora TaxID=2633591 RepID=UPI002E14A0D4|nr:MULTISPECIES: EthD family reductase [unclassified Kitasatospora]WSJ67854.1 EthD family reductase [Kitasatospora sp. NBC_01302]